MTDIIIIYALSAIFAMFISVLAYYRIWFLVSFLITVVTGQLAVRAFGVM